MGDPLLRPMCECNDLIPVRYLKEYLVQSQHLITISFYYYLPHHCCARFRICGRARGSTLYPDASVIQPPSGWGVAE